MKKLILFFFICVIYSDSFSQVDLMHRFHKGKYEGDFVVFRINGRNYKTNWETFLYKQDTIFHNRVEEIVYFAVYDKKYLFAAYYPAAEAHMATGYEDRTVRRMEVIELRRPSKKWQYDLKATTTLRKIVSFDALTGNLRYNNGAIALPSP